MVTVLEALIDHQRGKHVNEDPLVYIPDELDQVLDHARYTVQVVLGRHSTREFWIVDITLWDWINFGDLDKAVTQNQYMCPSCYGRMEATMCTKCHTLVDDVGQRHSNIMVRGDLGFVADIVSKVFEGIYYDADVLVMFTPVPVDSDKQVREFGRLPIEEALERSEYRLYTRDALSRDTAAGASLNDCLGMFIRG